MANALIHFKGSLNADGTEQVDIPLKVLDNGDGTFSLGITTTPTNPTHTLSGTATVLPSYPAIKGFQAVGTATGAFTVDLPIECSNDSTNWKEVFYLSLSGTDSDNAIQVWESNIKYWRIGTARNETGTGVSYSVTVAV